MNVGGVRGICGGEWGGEDTCGTPDLADVRQERGSVEALYKTTRGCVSSFCLCCAFVETENGPLCSQSRTSLLKKALVKKVIPWIHNHLVWTTMEKKVLAHHAYHNLREVNAFLADHLPHVHKDDEWSAIAYFFQVVTQERRDEYMRLEEMEREAMEAVRRCLEH